MLVLFSPKSHTFLSWKMQKPSQKLDWQSSYHHHHHLYPSIYKDRQVVGVMFYFLCCYSWKTTQEWVQQLPPRGQRHHHHTYMHTSAKRNSRQILPLRKQFFFGALSLPLKYETLHLRCNVLYHSFTFTSDRFICTRNETQISTSCSSLGFCKPPNSLVNASDLADASLALQLSNKRTRSL